MTTRPLLSTYWFRVRQLKPRLRGHVRIHRHEYRGEVWYVFEDRVSGRHHRFNFASYRVIHLLDGRRTMDEVWALLAEWIDDETPTQDDLIRLLGQLHSADLILADVTPDAAELFERRGKHERRKWMGRIGNPIALRIPLFDPDRLLTVMGRWLKPLDSWFGVLLWLAVIVPALVLVPSQWNALSANFNEQLLGAGNLLLLGLLFPLVKIAHELGHGLICKWRGGEVHETGVMLLALYPIPFVDVSNTAAFVSKWQRALVGAAGMLIELFIAAIAFYAWLLLEPGLARSIAWNVAVLASVTTLFFNANPLLRYDGYYILADAIEISNLGARANRHWQYLADRFVFGVKNPERPPATPGERRWFVGYAPLAYVYRLFVSFAIAIFVAQQFFFVGVAMALWTVGQGFLWPIFKGLKALATAPRYADRLARIRGVLAGGALLAAVLLFVVPLPYHSNAEGVLWLPERAIVRAGASGFVREVVAQPGAAVEAGQPVAECVEPALAARIAAQQARFEEAQAKVDAAWTESQAKVQQLEQQLAVEQAALARLQDDARLLTVRAGAAGTLMMDRPADLPGRFIRKGEVVAYLRTADAPLARVVVPQSDIDNVRDRTRAVVFRLPQASGETFVARFQRGVPSASKSLPSAVLGQGGGGEIATAPGDTKGLQTLESVFEFELALSASLPHHYLGSRLHVRFEHEPQPVGQRWWRALRRLFLSTFQI